MCCLYGFYNYGGKEIKDITELTNSLAEQATIRGTDAAGIAYINKNKLEIQKDGKSATNIKFKHPDDSICVTGHTRHATQGSYKKNFNNHPFSGRCNNVNFALAHNGVLMNDRELRKAYHLPCTRIETDSYVAVQLIEKTKHLDIDSIRFMAEKVDGSFAFSILDTNNILWLVKGDSPLSLLHLPKQKLYVYASTEEILFKALVDTPLFEEIKNGDFEEIKVRSGDILKITTSGEIIKDKFEYTDYSSWGRCSWWMYDMPFNDIEDKSYITNLKAVASYQGYSPEVVDELLESGFSPDEIEEYIYCMDGVM